MGLKSANWSVPSQSNSLFAPVSLQASLIRKLLVFLCITLAFILRLYHLGTQNFWYDEVAALRYASDLALQDVHPPTYYLLLRLTLQLGQSEFIVRFLSVIPGILSVPLVYVIGRRLFGYRTALTAMLLASVSPLLIWHAQDARMYSLLLFSCLLTVYAYLRTVEENTRRSWLLFGLAGLLALYSHLYAVLMLGTLGLHFLVFHREQFKSWFITHVILGLCYAPWLLVLISLPGKQIGSGQDAGLLSGLYNYYAFVNGYSLGPSINELRGLKLSIIVPYLPLIVPIALVTVALVLAGVYYLRREGREKLFLILGWAVLPVVIAIIIPYLRPGMTYNVRYVLFAAPAILLIMAIGISHLKMYYLGIMLLFVLVCYNAVAIYNNAFDQRYAKEDVRQAAGYVAAHAEANDRVLVVTVGSVFDWYFQPDNLVVSNVPKRPAEELVQDAETDAHSVWLVKSRVWQTDPDNEIQAVLDSRYVVADTVSFTGVTVTRYCITDCSAP